MIRNTTFLFLIFFLIFSIYVFYKVFFIRSVDKKNFSELINNSHNLKKPHCFLKQKRKNIQKDIYFNLNNELYHTKITSLASDINLEIINKKIKATETLYDLEFWMQEKIEHNFQKVKYFNASYGKYFFSTHQFISDEVNLVCFNAKGNKLSDMLDTSEILMKAKAKHIFFQLNNTGANFRADHIKIKLPEKSVQEIKPKILNAKNKESKEKL
jgi:hypothetical protein